MTLEFGWSTAGYWSAIEFAVILVYVVVISRRADVFGQVYGQIVDVVGRGVSLDLEGCRQLVMIINVTWVCSLSWARANG